MNVKNGKSEKEKECERASAEASERMSFVGKTDLTRLKAEVRAARRPVFLPIKKISVLGDTAESGGAPILKRPKGEFCRAERVSEARLFEVLRGNRQMTFVF